MGAARRRVTSAAAPRAAAAAADLEVSAARAAAKLKSESSARGVIVASSSTSSHLGHRHRRTSHLAPARPPLTAPAPALAAAASQRTPPAHTRALRNPPARPARTSAPSTAQRPLSADRGLGLPVSLRATPSHAAMAHLGSDAAGPSRPPLSRAAQLAPPPRSHELRFSLAPPASEGGLLLALPGDAASAASSSSSIPSAAPPARLRASKSPLSLSEAQPQRAAPPSATHAELGPLPRSPRPPSLASACALTLAARLRLPPRVFPRSTKPRASAAASGRDSAGAPIDRSDDRQHALTADNLLRAQASVAVGMGILAPAGRVGEATGRGFMPVADDTVVVSPPASTAGASTSGVRSPRSPTVPAWGAPRSWANLASTSNGISISVPASGAASAAASASASPSAPLSPASRRKKSSHSGQQAQKRPQLSLKDRLRAAERSFAAPLTRPRGMINTGNFCFANAVSRPHARWARKSSVARHRSCKCSCTARPSRISSL